MNTSQENNLNSEIKEILITAEQMQERVKELGYKVSQDFAGKELVVVGVLKGSVLFLADLVREITIPITIDFISVSSYGHSISSSGKVTLKKDVDQNINGKHVLVVEDIIDTGLTLKFIKDFFVAKGAASVSICSALDKPSRRDKSIDISVEYIGFEVPDEFVVGYGLDYSEKYRNLPYICVLSPEVYGKI